MKPDNTPGGLGYFFPPEWHKHRATWLSWPHNIETWPGGIEPVYQEYLHFIDILARQELVCINITNSVMEAAVRSRLLGHGVDLTRVQFYHHPTNDAWCRDHGPCFLINHQGEKVVVNWDYNAWGGKYPPYDLDNEVPVRIAQAFKLQLYRPGLILEGGSVEFNGRGTILTTTSCLLNPNRNPGITVDLIEQRFNEYFGIEQVLWLDHGICGDDTDGHIDTITRFVNPDTVVTVLEEDPLENNYRPLQENLKALKKMRLINGRSLQVIPLPMPRPIFNGEQRLPASYANFYICNGAVLAPTFRDPNDEAALSVLASVFKDHQVVGIDSSEIIRGLGSLHCLCMQEPLVEL